MQYLITYIFIKNKESGNISNNISIISKQSALNQFDEAFTIHVAGETQNPDCDLVIVHRETKKMMILSLKTSLRERAGQTYKWKLLLEIAHSTDKALKNKYGISYHGGEMPLICFATVNFYNIG